MKKLNILVGETTYVETKGDQRITVNIVQQQAGKVIAVPVGTPGAETMPNGTIWMEY